MRIIFDPVVFQHDPGLLFLNKSGVKFLIPRAYFTELFAKINNDPWRKEFDRKLAGGFIEALYPRPNPAGQNTKESSQLSERDQLLIATIYDYVLKNGGPDIFFVSPNLKLLAAAQSFGIESIHEDQLRTILELPTGREQSVPSSPLPSVSEVKSTTSSTPLEGTRRFYLQSFVAGSFTTVLLLALWINKSDIIQSFSVWGVTLSTASVGVFLFWFRSRFRLAYGMVEVLFGLLATTRYANPTSYNSTFFLQIISGLYIVVRGLDNIDKGLIGSNIEPRWWKVLFGNLEHTAKKTGDDVTKFTQAVARLRDENSSLRQQHEDETLHLLEENSDLRHQNSEVKNMLGSLAEAFQLALQLFSLRGGSVLDLQSKNALAKYQELIRDVHSKSQDSR